MLLKHIVAYNSEFRVRTSGNYAKKNLSNLSIFVAAVVLNIDGGP